MTAVSIVLFLVSVVLLAASFWSVWNAHRTMRGLEDLIRRAEDGSFDETDLSESRLSRLEAKLARVLSSGALARRRVTEDQLRVKQLIGDISHQTKTPLANISLYSQLLLEQPLSEEAHSMADQTAAQAEKLTFLIESLVKASRLESGMVQVRPEKEPVRPMLEAIVSEFSSHAREKEVALSISSQEGLSARFDRKWTAEAIANIIDNALKYTPKGGHVTITTRGYELFCRIDVTDDGPGISESEQAKIFGRFYRGEAFRTKPGVGIGLYLARRIITDGGGYIRVRSAPHQGAVFSVFLSK